MVVFKVFKSRERLGGEAVPRTLAREPRGLAAARPASSCTERAQARRQRGSPVPARPSQPLPNEAAGPAARAQLTVGWRSVTFLDHPCQILLSQEQGRRPPGRALRSQLRRRLLRAAVLESSKQESGSGGPPRRCFFPDSDFVLLDVSLWSGTWSTGAQLTQDGPATACQACRAWLFE